MKLNVKVTKEDGSITTKEIDIKNKNATVANMRAAICIIMKLGDVGAFRFSSPDADLAKDDTLLLTNTKLVDGSVVLVRSKRSRDTDDEEPPAPTSTAPVAASSSAPEIKEEAVEHATAEKITELTAMGFTEAQAKTALQRTSGHQQRAIEMILSGHVSDTGALQGGASGNTPARAAPQGMSELVQRLMNEGGLELLDGDDDDLDFDEEEEEEEFLGDGDFQDDDEFEEEEETEEDAERSQLAMGLMALGNPNELSQQFLANPQEMLARIQREQPELYALIGRHNQFFIDLVNTGAELPGQDDGSGSDDGEDGGDDNIMALAAAAQAMGVARERGRAARGGGAPTATATPAAPAPLTEKDNENIEGLTQLGFSKEQCTAAYLKCGRNPERAGNYLFENPPPQ